MFKRLLQLVMASPIIMTEGLAKTEKVSIAATEWAPLTSAESLHNGLLADMTRAALKRVGYEANFVILPWKRAFEMTKKGRYDALLGASYLDERTADFIYPNYAWPTLSHFHALKGPRRWKFTDLKSLCPATIGILIGSFHRNTLLHSGCLKVHENTSIKQNLQMLMRGRIDLYLAVPEVLQHYIEKDFPEAQDKITTLQPAYIVDNVYLVFPRVLDRSTKLARDYERGIEMIKADGTYAEILKRHSITPRP